MGGGRAGRDGGGGKDERSMGGGGRREGNAFSLFSCLVCPPGSCMAFLCVYRRISAYMIVSVRMFVRAYIIVSVYMFVSVYVCGFCE